MMEKEIQGREFQEREIQEKEMENRDEKTKKAGVHEKDNAAVPIHPELRVRLCTDEPIFGPGTICLLKLIDAQSSMKEACSEMDMSYSKGWKIINRAEKGLGYSLINRRHGGNRGGRCTLTEEAKDLVRRYELLEQNVKKNMEEQFYKLFHEYERL